MDDCCQGKAVEIQNLRGEHRKVLVIVLVSYLTVSHLVWWRLTSRLEEVNSQIVDLEKRLDSTTTTTKR